MQEQSQHQLFSRLFYRALTVNPGLNPITLESAYRKRTHRQKQRRVPVCGGSVLQRATPEGNAFGLRVSWSEFLQTGRSHTTCNYTYTIYPLITYSVHAGTGTTSWPCAARAEWPIALELCSADLYAKVRLFPRNYVGWTQNIEGSGALIAA